MSKIPINAKLHRPPPYQKIRDIPAEAWKRKEWPITELEIPEEEEEKRPKDRKLAAAGEEIDDF